jgi:hypothetical protein
MEQEPYEFQVFAPAKPESKGKATHGIFRKHALLASQKKSFERGHFLRFARSPSSAASLPEPKKEIVARGEKWATRKTPA